ncbi:MAG: alpha/beta hydrolase [Opitutaceae bacterium]|nr:alpha/beta hydrolase [Opitutaceae bacterium]
MPARQPPPLFILPGMGADDRMYPGPWKTLPRASFINWPAHRGETTIHAIARRIIEEAPIPPDAILIGSSLGGIVACEIAGIQSCRRLILVGSATSPAEINTLLRILHPLAALAPVPFIQMAAGKIPADLTRMFHDSEPAFIHAMCHAIFHWPGLDPRQPRPFRIHGRHDRAIPPPAHADHMLNAGHLVAMTHPDECVRLIRRVIG